ncbi:MAG TPA: radical SAM/Cys-rich domain protein [Deltaproteobacteria bacterium]|nr:radical SAM/Cys-rich domain protein [Deltaproteobacteria bacterium]
MNKTESQESPFDERLRRAGLYPLTSQAVDTVQINVGRRCNLSCAHCHVEAGPRRRELMSDETLELVFSAVERCAARTVDITGGAPELHPRYRSIVERFRSMGLAVMTRTNLTVLLEEGCGDLIDFLASLGVEVVASLPHYIEGTTDRQRGPGVFARSIEALRRLNAAGYGVEGSPLVLDLVYNPAGAFFPPSQSSLEADFRRELKRRHGVVFTRLFTITNMPIGRFGRTLEDKRLLQGYMERLEAAFNPEAAGSVMCRTMLSVGWDGSLYDCDFNQMLGLRCNHGAPEHLRDFDVERLRERRIVTGRHCYGCTAGAGSSCGGEVA